MISLADCVNEHWIWLLHLVFILNSVELDYVLMEKAAWIDLNKALTLFPYVMLIVIFTLIASYRAVGANVIVAIIGMAAE